ncbi:MAG: NADH-quinone oxidoreductase subunit NuoE [Beijerinckiaceae bacterium]
MSVRRLAPDAVQPASFAFTKENAAWAKTIIAKYPTGRQASAVIPLLWRAQEQHDYWLPKVAIEKVAQMLDMTYIRVFEVATFYTMFNLGPVGKHFVQVCGTTPCRLRGAEKIIDICKSEIGEERHVSADGTFAWLEVECLGACCNAPMVQINNDFYEDLDEKNFTKLLKDMRAGKAVKIGSQIGRVSSEPVKGQKTLKDKGLYDGSAVGNWKTGFAERVKKVEAAKKLAAKEAAKGAVASAPAAALSAAVVVAKPAASPAAVTKPVPVAAKPSSKSAPAPKAPAKADVYVDDGGPEKAPAKLKAARKGGADDLKLIWGVGPKMELLLQSMGFFHFDQIAGWSDDNLRYVDRRLEGFKGRARRDDWIGQAKKLATGWRPAKAAGDKPVK